jgi:hypothetical protein
MADAAMANFHAISNIYGSKPLLHGNDVIDPGSGARPSIKRT